LFQIVVQGDDLMRNNFAAFYRKPMEGKFTLALNGKWRTS
jgi:hypothetical protein